jgi:hypothetical protein
MQRQRLIECLALALVMVGCTSSGDDEENGSGGVEVSSEPSCVPEEVSRCYAEVNGEICTGEHVCNDEGDGFGECVCTSVGAGGADGSGGADAAGGDVGAGGDGGAAGG